MSSPSRRPNCLAFFKCLSSKKQRPVEEPLDDQLPSGGRSKTLQARVSNSSAFDQLALTNSQQRQNSNEVGANSPRMEDMQRNLPEGVDGDVQEQLRILDEIRAQNSQKMKDRNKVRINTIYLKQDIECLDHYPIGQNPEDAAQREIFKYYCPICLRYFNHILISDCCENYICRLCIGWQAKKAKKEPQYQINCSHCYADNFRLTDVDVNDKHIKYYTDTPFKVLKSAQKNSHDMTPRDFEEGKVNEFVTPGNAAEVSALIGVVGSFEASNPEVESKTQSISLPQIVKAPSTPQKVSEKTISNNESLPQILSLSEVKSHHVETDRTIRAMTIRHTIKNVSKPIDVGSSQRASKNSIYESSNKRPPNTEKMTKLKTLNRYDKIIQSNNFLRSGSEMQSGSKKKGHFSRRIAPDNDQENDTIKRVVIQSRDNIVNFLDMPKPFQDITNIENPRSVLRIKKSAVNYKDKENNTLQMRSARKSSNNANRVITIPREQIRMNSGKI